jgi:glucose-6-phosphate 1-dehydrogenase
VRNDELRESWKLFDGLLTEIAEEAPTPFIYKRGERGPTQADDKLRELGVTRTRDYDWSTENKPTGR